MVRAIEIPTRLWKHLRNGTLGDRLRFEWQRYLDERKRLHWVSQCEKRGSVVVSLGNGTRIRLYCDSVLCKNIYFGAFEEAERKFAKNFLRPGDIYVDVGANIGLFTVIAASRVGRLGHVWAFEPCFTTFTRLFENVALNRLRNVTCFQIALSDTIGQLDLRVSLDGYDAWNSLAEPYVGGRYITESVECTTWDTFAQVHELVGRVTMMKIDVEGWESRVLRGARETLSRYDAPVLQVEFTDAAAQCADSSCHALYYILRDYGYQLFTYDSTKNEIVPEPLRESYPYVNIIAAKEPEKVAARLREGFCR
jgi:FkbM family methyltransferase